MGNLFNIFKKDRHQSRVTDHDRAVLQLKQMRDKLRQYQRRIEQNLERDRQVAKQLLHTGRKEKALLLLRKKKYQETQLARADTQMENIENMIQSVEFAQVETQVMASLERGNSALKKMHDVLSLEDVERIMDETQEAVEYQREIDALLAGGLTDDDEADVLAELEQLTSTEEEPSLPEVPTAEPPEAVKQPTPAKSQPQRTAILAS